MCSTSGGEGRTQKGKASGQMSLEDAGLNRSLNAGLFRAFNIYVTFRVSQIGLAMETLCESISRDSSLTEDVTQNQRPRAFMILSVLVLGRKK